MSKVIESIAVRIKELREILDIEKSDMADRLGCDTAFYEKYENAEIDIPISALYRIAEILGVDTTVLLTGDMPRMVSYSVTRSGEGVTVERFPGYNYQSLSFNFKNRNMDPLLVTLSDEKEPDLITHTGQEFNYVLEGRIRIKVGEKEFVLEKGDSIYFDPTLPHGQSSISGKSVFLTVIKE